MNTATFTLGGTVRSVELSQRDCVTVNFDDGSSVTLDYEAAQAVALHAQVLRQARVDREKAALESQMNWLLGGKR